MCALTLGQNSHTIELQFFLNHSILTMIQYYTSVASPRDDSLSDSGPIQSGKPVQLGRYGYYNVHVLM